MSRTNHPQTKVIEEKLRQVYEEQAGVGARIYGVPAMQLSKPALIGYIAKMNLQAKQRANQHLETVDKLIGDEIVVRLQTKPGIHPGVIALAVPGALMILGLGLKYFGVL